MIQLNYSYYIYCVIGDGQKLGNYKFISDIPSTAGTFF